MVLPSLPADANFSILGSGAKRPCFGSHWKYLQYLDANTLNKIINKLLLVFVLQITIDLQCYK